MSSDRKLPDLGAWRALSLKLIAFTERPAVDTSQSWWRDLTGQEPEQTKKGTTREDKGNIGNVHLSVATNLIQIVWHASPVVTPENISHVPDLGSFPEAKESFQDQMLRWLPNCPPIYRLAFAAKCIIPTKTKDESYLTFGALVPSVQVDPSSTDLLYRVNRKKRSSVISDRQLNRLVKWNCVRFSISFGATSPSTKVFETEQDACMVEIDINTDGAVTNTLPSDDLVSLFRELMQIGEEIIQNGERT